MSRGLAGISQHVTGWTWKHEEFDELCPKFSRGRWGHVCTEGIMPWLLNDHAIPRCFPMRPWRSSWTTVRTLPLECISPLVWTQIPSHNFHHAYLQDSSQKIPYNPWPALSILTMWELCATFLSTEDVMGCGPKRPWCKSKTGARDTLNQWEFEDSREPWPHGFHPVSKERRTKALGLSCHN